MLSAFLKTIAGAQCAVLAQGGEPEHGFWVLLLYYLAACGGGFLLFRAVSLGLKPVPVKGRDKASLAAFLFALALSSGFEALFGLREAFCAEVGFLPRSSGLPFRVCPFMNVRAAAARRASVAAKKPPSTAVRPSRASLDFRRGSHTSNWRRISMS